MSMLSSQADRLRETADTLDKIYVVSTPWIHANLTPMLREAADTIEKLEPHSNQLEPSRWHELFGTPERAAQTMAGICESCKCCDCATCGVPEWADYSHDYDALLEWLRGDA